MAPLHGHHRVISQDTNKFWPVFIGYVVLNVCSQSELLNVRYIRELFHQCHYYYATKNKQLFPNALVEVIKILDTLLKSIDLHI